MPVYTYECRACGSFDELRTVEQRNHALACPYCSQPAQRVMVAPHLALMNPSVRRAHSTNERSQHAPRLSTGHTCSSHCEHGPGKSIRTKRTKETKFGVAQTSKATARPWMLGH